MHDAEDGNNCPERNGEDPQEGNEFTCTRNNNELIECHTPRDEGKRGTHPGEERAFVCQQESVIDFLTLLGQILTVELGALRPQIPLGESTNEIKSKSHERDEDRANENRRRSI